MKERKNLVNSTDVKRKKHLKRNGKGNMEGLVKMLKMVGVVVGQVPHNL